MRFVSAALLFPLRPADATPRLDHPIAAILVAALPGLAVGLAIRLAGADWIDAGAVAGAVFALGIGLGIGGALGTRVAGAVVGTSMKGRLGPCLIFGAWTVALFVIVLLLARLSGAFALAGLIAGLVVLVWGAVAGIGVIDPGGEFEYGRALVGSCVGVTGAILGLYLAAMPVKRDLAFVVPAPPDAARSWEPGDFFLIRPGEDAPEGSIVLLHDRRTGEGLVAEVGSDGRPRPIGPTEAYESGWWTVAGRVFLRVGGGGATPVPKH